MHSLEFKYPSDFWTKPVILFHHLLGTTSTHKPAHFDAKVKPTLL